MRAESGLVVKELDVTRVSLMEVGLIMVRLMVMRLETIKLGRKCKNCLNLKIGQKRG